MRQTQVTLTTPPTLPATERLAYSIEEAALLLSIGRTKLYAEIRGGRLRATKCGRRTLILARDIHAFVDQIALQGGQ